MRATRHAGLLLATVVAVGACGGDARDEPMAEPGLEQQPVGAVQQPAVPPTGQAAPPGGALRFEIVKSARELHVYRGEERVATHAVAIGEEPEHATPTGEFRITRVDWNPDWTPPDSEWAADEEPREPGDPENPMGRARLVFQEPYTIHGTDDTASLGRAASHGSVRVANEVVMELARLVMEAGGAGRSEAWYAEARGTPDEMRQVSIPEPVPLRIRD
jgi:lipoprotein-anchoring transpeptidase ErfK/SrfK